MFKNKRKPKCLNTFVNIYYNYEQKQTLEHKKNRSSIRPKKLLSKTEK